MKAYRKIKFAALALLVGAVPLVSVGSCTIDGNGLDLVVYPGHNWDYDYVDVWVDDGCWGGCYDYYYVDDSWWGW
ncbi:MAG TPA: hypothetical protein PKK06_04180 [Phycisphaerae bacterium]|nr:hypothetical protein [Phycisphaerae bacterium]HNU44860.1 hypothetical protein [Phycisphaerae bacterium]